MKGKRVVSSVVVALMVTATPSFSGQCGCEPGSDDPVCKAYYQLKEAGIDVRVTCGEGYEEEKFEVITKKENQSNNPQIIKERTF